ncbi:C4b-binding protein alpha chain-like isoform X1 [Xiphophorus couchianus]|uniref:C4b-binding protein alpha chain-like isoform X1 n=1 Tax=Xiphophorus couchianus TaxID=32473 RepID=UPI001016818D|nr:C4b-binding protein alpha chain-like isoform X1 [Xiphophorus couchianus]
MNVLFLLSSFGLVITCLAQQCSKPTGGSHMHLKDEYITKSTFEDGASVSFSCAPGYTSAGGSPRITCSAGAWSTLQLKCERRNCGALPDVNKGDIEYKDGTEFGDTAVVTCRSGYMLVGQSVLRCEVQGWMGRVPTCDEVKCVTPAEIVNGRFSPKKDFYGYAEVVRYSCDKDLELRGARDLFCSENGKFSSAAPTCVRVECKDPEIINGFWESGSRPPHKYRASVTFKCKPEYTMIGNPTVTCNIDSKWSPGLPKCTSNGNALVGLLTGALARLRLMVQVQKPSMFVEIFPQMIKKVQDHHQR